ncbi:hypothetical protein AAMO2058_001253100 [Amorphochlora amoebiformis]
MSAQLSEKTGGEVDLYRDTNVRYLGYANELGEAFRPLINVNIVRLSYGISSMYVLADTYDKVQKADKKYAKAPPRVRTAEKVEAGVDTCLWQALASVIIPGFTIHQVVHWSKSALLKVKAPKPAITTIPTLLGLGAIPFIVHPIDGAVHWGMDNTTRAWGSRLKEWFTGIKKA